MSRFPNRIVCLTEETTETLYLLGQGDRIVGVSVVSSVRQTMRLGNLDIGEHEAVSVDDFA